jgi:TonB family protein
MCQNVDDERPAPGACESLQVESFQPSLLRRGVFFAFALARRSIVSVTTIRLTAIRGWRCSMSEVWSQCEGQVVDNKFRLRQFLGETDDSAVFLTSLPEPSSKKAAIKFIPAGTTADLQLSLWRRVMQLTHPQLLRIHDIGRCRLANRDRLYVVMEYADEDLSQILPLRTLTESEAREMLGPVLGALVFLHGHGLLHSRLKPSNILATADQLKLSSDSLFPIGESRKSSRRFDPHDAPEIAVGPLTAATDVWSLGMTLVETLTQRVPASQPGSPADPLVPDALPQPFLDIARHALRRDPRRRWTIPEIAARLNPAAFAATAAQTISPLAVPLSSVPAIPAARLPIPDFQPPAPKAQAQPQAKPPRPQAAKNFPSQSLVLPNYVVPVAAGLLVIVAIFALPKILGHRSDSSSSASTASTPAAAPPSVVEPPARRATPPSPKPSAPQKILKAPAEKKPAPPPQTPPPAAPTPASVRTETFSSANAPSTPASSIASSPGTSTASPSARGEVLDQILPDASPGALATIHGVVRVAVRVHVDPTGNVSDATLDSPGPSQYFADLALKAARKWQFNSPDVGGHSVPSEWLIRFHFTPAGPKAMPTQTAP